MDGKAAVVVQDAASYQELLEQMEKLGALAGIQRGLDALKRGEMRPLHEVLDSQQRKHELGAGRMPVPPA